MDAHDLDPNFFLPLWQAVVTYFRRHPPLIQAPQRLSTRRRRL